VPDAAIVDPADTLLHPLHRESGELERFHRVIANPPFSQNYTRTNMEFPERFHWGWCPTTGKKGDLMFAQHMLAVCYEDGMVATVMPHGVLFRGGAEKEIRRRFLEEDLIECVIGLPQNLFYGAGIPACILIMRPNLSRRSPNPNKPEERRGQVFFINADAEFYAGRAQNYMRPEHVEKVVSTYERWQDVPGYARRVSIEEIGGPANDWNLNIRRYVDNSAPPEPHDVRAHLLGGVPVREVEAQRALFVALGFDSQHLFVPNEEVSTATTQYFDFAPAVTEKAALRPLIESDAGVQARLQQTRDGLRAWWAEHAQRLAALPERRDLNAVRREFLESFVTTLETLRTLDHYKLAGVIATWWTDTLPDFKTLVENGFAGVIDGWVDAIADAVEDDEATGPAFDPFAHKLVLRLMTDYLERIAAAKADIARLKGEKEAFEQSNAPEDAEEEELEAWNYAKDLERQIRELRGDHRNALKELARLEKVAAKVRATAADKEAVTTARDALDPVLLQIEGLETLLAPYEQIKTDLSAARTRYRTLIADFVDELKSRCGVLSDAAKRDLVLGLLEQDVLSGLEAAVIEKRQSLVRFVEKLWEKYSASLARVTHARDSVAATLQQALGVIGYA
jgi:type I restriction enzyme M protein